MAKVKNKKLFWRIGVFLGISGFLFIIAKLLLAGPRVQLMLDLNESNTIVVVWPNKDNLGNVELVGYEIDANDRKQFIDVLEENVSLDYFRPRNQPLTGPRFYISVFSEEQVLLGKYVVKRARQKGDCPTMEFLIEIVSRGKKLDAQQINENSSLPFKQLSWMQVDFVLPKEQ